MVKVTFSVDEDTVRQIRRLAARTRKSQSTIVREAIALYAVAPEDVRIPEEERDRQLRILRTIRAEGASRSVEEADAELRELREARQGPRRAHPSP